MLRRLIPVVLVVAGAGLGVGAGLALRPPPTEEGPAPEPPEPEVGEREYVRLPSQFVVPLLDSGRVSGLVVLSLSLEVPPGMTDTVFAREPKLRDEFLRVLFDHANHGGFRGTFTDGATLAPVRRALLEAARKVVGNDVSGLLITDIVRQDP